MSENVNDTEFRVIGMRRNSCDISQCCGIWWKNLKRVGNWQTSSWQIIAAA